MSFFTNILEAVLKTARGLHIPSFNQWKKLPEVLSKKERYTLCGLCIVFISSIIFLLAGIYLTHTVSVPANKGSFSEGVIGTPRFLNPVYAEASDIDRSITQLVFSGLFTYDKNGKLVPDLASSSSITPDKTSYEITLKEGVTWHDGIPFNADDILFTIQTIQDPRYKSPVRANWVGVVVEKVSQYKVRFTLKEPFASFPDRLTQKILAKHIWENVGPENFALTSLNLQPTGTGPYRFFNISQDKTGSIKTLSLKANSKYYLSTPHIKEITFKFFSNEEDMIAQANLGRIQTMIPSGVATPKLHNASFTTITFSLPRYFAVFFQLDKTGSPIQKKNVRNALDLAIDRIALIQEIFQGQAEEVSSPVRPDLFGLSIPQQSSKQNIDQALSLLKKEGYQLSEGKLIKIQSATEDFINDLKLGSQGEEVTKLQQCLANPATGGSAIYPEGTINGVFGSATQKAVRAFQEKYATDILTPTGLTQSTGTVKASTRKKLNELCSLAKSSEDQMTLTLTTLDISPLKEVAEFLKKSWTTIGIQVSIESLSSGNLERDAIKPRNYEMLLFGEILGTTPDPLPFWHSSQKKDPGLNLSSYESKTADKILEQLRKESNLEKRTALLLELQSTIRADEPALFLYDTPFQYMVQKNIQGIKKHLIPDPAWRFAGIQDWYIQTKRVWR